MIENATDILKESKLINTLHKSILDTLCFVFVSTLFVWYAQYHWKRKRLYAFAAKRNGPFALPFIGNGWYLAGTNQGM